MKLTLTRIEDLKCEPGRRDRLVFDDEQRGLAVRVTSSGSKSYLAQYTYAGKRQRVPLGSCGAVSLADARAATKAIMGDVARGLDPAAIRKAEAAAARAEADRQAMTLSVLVDTWKTMHLAGKRPRYAAEAVRAVEHAFAKHWDKPAEHLDRSSVVRVLDALAKNGSVAMASRTAAYGRACFGWGLKRSQVHTNPFTDLPTMGAVSKRDRVLTDDELAEIWRATALVTSPFSHLVRVLMLTGQRREEVAGMAWGELSSDKTVWTIPASRTKNAQPHIVPLSTAVQGIVKAMPRRKALVRTEHGAEKPKDLPFVFAGEVGMFGGWSKAKAALDDKILEARRTAAEKAGEDIEKVVSLPGWRLHDLRRTMATGLQRLGVRLEVTEAVLNHVSGSRAGIVGVYQRHDWANEKEAALHAWAAYMAEVVSGRPAQSNVKKFAKQSA
jgi:integrase